MYETAACDLWCWKAEVPLFPPNFALPTPGHSVSPHTFCHAGASVSPFNSLKLQWFIDFFSAILGS